MQIRNLKIIHWLQNNSIDFERINRKLVIYLFFDSGLRLIVQNVQIHISTQENSSDFKFLQVTSGDFITSVIWLYELSTSRSKNYFYLWSSNINPMAQPQDPSFQFLPVCNQIFIRSSRIKFWPRARKTAENLSRAQSVTANQKLQTVFKK